MEAPQDPDARAAATLKKNRWRVVLVQVALQTILWGQAILIGKAHNFPPSYYFGALVVSSIVAAVSVSIVRRAGS